MTKKPPGVRSFVAATAGIAVALVLAWIAFASWREPGFVLTSFQGTPPVAPIYGFFDPRATLWSLAALAILALLAGAMKWLGRHRPGPAWVVTALVVLAFGFHLTVHAARSGDLPGRELATYAGETVLFDALRIESASVFLDRYAEIQPSLSLHGRTKPPGFALLYHALLHTVGRRLDVLGVLFTLLGSLLVWPTFTLARALGPRRSEDDPDVLAWGAAALAATAPAAVLFGAVSLDAVFALVAAVAFALVAVERLEPRLWRRLTLGLVLSGALLLSYSALPAMLLCGLGLGWFPRRRPGRLGLDLLQVGVTVVGSQALLAVSTGFDPWRTFFQARALNAASMTEMIGRDVTSWDVWLYATPGNLLAFLLFLGPAVLAGWVWLPWGESTAETRALAVALGVTLLVVSAGGLYLLETERILLFLVPPAAALAVRGRGVSIPFAVAVTGATALLFEVFLFTLK